VVGAFSFRDDSPADNGLGGRLLTRSERGGCGKELMLTVLRMVLPAPLMPETERGCGKAPVGAGLAGGRYVEDGARNPVFGVAGVDLVLPVLLRVFDTGNAGSADVGGASDGREGRGIEFDMLAAVSN